MTKLPVSLDSSADLFSPSSLVPERKIRGGCHDRTEEVSNRGGRGRRQRSQRGSSKQQKKKVSNSGEEEEEEVEEVKEEAASDALFDAFLSLPASIAVWKTCLNVFKSPRIIGLQKSAIA